MFQTICNRTRTRAALVHRFRQYHWSRWVNVQRLLTDLSTRERGAATSLLVLAGRTSRTREAALALMGRDSFDSQLVRSHEFIFYVDFQREFLIKCFATLVDLQQAQI